MLLSEMWIRTKKDYSQAELDKLLFESADVYLYMYPSKKKLTNISIIEAEYSKIHIVSDDSYDIIHYPAYFISAESKLNNEEVFIKGVIRPQIDKTTGRIIHGVSSELSFFLITKNKVYAGKSIKYTNNPKVLTVEMSSRNKETYDRFARIYMRKKPYHIPAGLEIKINTENRLEETIKSVFVTNSLR